MRTVPDTAAVNDALPGAHVELLVREGQRLSENDDDPLSHRLAVVALSAADRPTLVERFAQASALLPFQLAPLPVPVTQRSPSQ